MFASRNHEPRALNQHGDEVLADASVLEVESAEVGLSG